MSSRSRALADATVQAMLDALAQDIDERPEVLQPIDARLVEHVRSLVAGVEVDLDQPLPPECSDAGLP